MIRKDIYAFHIIQCLKEITQLLQILIFICNTRDEYMANPNWFPDITQITSTIQDIPVRMFGQFTMLLIINMFDVQEYRVCYLHQSLKLLKESPLTGKQLCRSIETGIDTTTVRFLKQFQQEVDLQQSLATAHRDATFVTPVSTEPFRLVEQVICSPFLSHSHFPGIRIMAELTAHRTSLQKYQETYAWSIYRTKAFYAVNKSFHAPASVFSCLWII